MWFKQLAQNVLLNFHELSTRLTGSRNMIKKWFLCVFIFLFLFSFLERILAVKEEEEDVEEKMDHKKKDTIDELHKSLTTLNSFSLSNEENFKCLIDA